MNKIIYSVITVFLVLACSSEKPANTAGEKSATNYQGAPQKSAAADGSPCAVELTPKLATRSCMLKLIPTGLNLSGAKIEWLVNGRSYISPVPNQFDTSDVAKGATVQARVLIQNREVMSNVVQILNFPPEITKVKLLPEVFKPGDAMSVEVEGKDVDGDAVSFFYEWTRNGETAGNGCRIEAPLKRGDKVSVKVTPFDGENYGVPRVLKREIRNMPPSIFEHREFNFDGLVYSYQVKASDPDDDALMYFLEGAPDGMVINESTGLITWTVPAEFKGDSRATAVVNDGNGGIARYNLKISIK